MTTPLLTRATQNTSTTWHEVKTTGRVRIVAPDSYSRNAGVVKVLAESTGQPYTLYLSSMYESKYFKPVEIDLYAGEKIKIVYDVFDLEKTGEGLTIIAIGDLTALPPTENTAFSDGFSNGFL
ncbi:hypothetical protein [Endozoicomonas sp. Mp262]|uniref:hypothetical protein n=1 Tax=Endozoicomonas sp. Mp262 TaxID=2919499 RepID=UPI0021DAAE7F